MCVWLREEGEIFQEVYESTTRREGGSRRSSVSSCNRNGTGLVLMVDDATLTQLDISRLMRYHVRKKKERKKSGIPSEVEEINTNPLLL